jgi:geranylgeranyl diphosphate synthase type I
MFARYKDRVERQLSQAVPASEDDNLYTLLRYHLNWVDPQGRPVAVPTSQGKALRPTLCMFACDALCGSPIRAVRAAAAMELIHNFSLIHDDVQDQDVERRHQATVWSLWGIPKALVAGDAMQTLGDLLVLGSGAEEVSPETTLKVSSLLTESYLEMIEGQCLDLGFENNPGVTAGDYLQMIAFKTGALIRNSLTIGALLATNDPVPTEAFSRFGNGLGRAFQIRDDFLGIWGDAATTGKSTDSDIRRRKKSFPVVYAFERARGQSREDLLRIYQQEELDDSDVDRVLEVLREVGAHEESERLTQESAQQALLALDGIDLPPWAQADAEELVDFLARRDF